MHPATLLRAALAAVEIAQRTKQARWGRLVMREGEDRLRRLTEEEYPEAREDAAGFISPVADGLRSALGAGVGGAVLGGGTAALLHALSKNPRKSLLSHMGIGAAAGGLLTGASAGIPSYLDSRQEKQETATQPFEVYNQFMDEIDMEDAEFLRFLENLQKMSH
jgi:hypothetical protein